MINSQGDMVAIKNFGGKKAAPFVKGGGLKKSSTKTARGTLKKTARKK